MRIYILLIVLLQFVSIDTSNAEVQPEEMLVADPFLEMHTGAASSFPIFYVVQRGDWIKILKRRTDWYQIVTINT